MHIHVETSAFINAHVLVIPYIVCVLYLYMCTCMYSVYASFHFMPWLSMTTAMGTLSFPLGPPWFLSFIFLWNSLVRCLWRFGWSGADKGECQPGMHGELLDDLGWEYGLTCLRSWLSCPTLWPRCFLVWRSTFHSCQIFHSCSFLGFLGSLPSLKIS